MKSGRKDFIFDMETIGPNVFCCPLVDVAYTVFEWDRFLEEPYTFEEIASTVQTLKGDVQDQIKNYGAKFNTSDVEWWEKLPKLARDKLNPCKDTDLTIDVICDTMMSYIKDQNGIDYWWSRGNTFDPVILHRMMLATDKMDEFNKCLKFYMVRDIRTHIDAKFDYSVKNGFIPVSDLEYWKETFIAHDSTHDVAADVLRLQTIHRGENDMEQTNR